MNKLQLAMANADINALDSAGQEIGAEAVQKALAEFESGPRKVDLAKAEAAEAERQRELDAALADAVEVVARQRQRLGRRTCSTHDGAAVRRVFELLRGMLPVSGDADPGF
jgi:hypothetical protein